MAEGRATTPGNHLRVLNRTLTDRVGELELAADQLEQTSRLHTAVIESMSEGVYAVDQDGRLTLMNAAASRILGWSADELRGRRLEGIVHQRVARGSHSSAQASRLPNGYRDHQPISGQVTVFRHKEGSTVPVVYSASPLLSDGSLHGTVVVFRQVTVEQLERWQTRQEMHGPTWVGRIREALDEGRLQLYSQPIIALGGGLDGEELLLRMVSREGELITPGAFLPTAERYGLIGEIDRWVVTEAIRLAARGRRVDLNLSAASVEDPELLSRIQREIRAARADPAKIVFEITETALMRDVDAGEAFARGLTELGCSLALDDFGTGFGSFTYLRRFPISYLKIDVDFVRQLGSNRSNQRLVKAIVDLAQGLGLRTIAEGVEDAAALALLRVYGVDYAQGLHIGSATPS